jgi:hypothetical protein
VMLTYQNRMSTAPIQHDRDQLSRRRRARREHTEGTRFGTFGAELAPRAVHNATARCTPRHPGSSPAHTCLPSPH